MGFEYKMVARTQVLICLLLAALANAQNPPVPVVIWHGMGDSCCNPVSMGRIKEVIEGETNGYVKSLKIGLTVIDDTINGFLKDTNKQIEMVVNKSLRIRNYKMDTMPLDFLKEDNFYELWLK